MRPFATIAAGRSRSIAVSANRMAPLHGRTRPEMAWFNVDFPAPLAPSTATMSPCGTLRPTPRRFSVVRYPACRPLTARMVSGIGGSRRQHSAGRAVAEIGLHDARIARDRLRRALRNDASFGQDEHMFGKAHDGLHDMLDHDDGDAAAANGPDDRHHI